MFSRMKALYYDSERCVACRNCEVACAMAWKGTDSIHQALTAPFRPKTRIFLLKQDKSTIILSCRHCEIPPCKEACPVDAIEGGKNLIHVIDQDKCTKCGTCLTACPSRFNAVKVLSGEPVPVPIPAGEREVKRTKGES